MLSSRTALRRSAVAARRQLSSVSWAEHNVPGVSSAGLHEDVRDTSAKKRWNPNEIWPSKKGEVRLNGNTLRDGHQSCIGGQHRIEHLEQAAKLVDACRRPGLVYPGVEEVGGGTTVDFPLRHKGEHPFHNMRRISACMPNTPTMALIRSDNLCAYTIQPRDVGRKFIELYAKAGIDVFRVFDAYNNLWNQENVAEAVHAQGQHYQGAITFTTHRDPTVFNLKWVRSMAKGLESLGAHSICIKDMAGIASPAMMRDWVHEIKDAVPDLPLVIHSHYTTGFAPITYLEALRAGANSVDCAIDTLSGKTGHPSLQVLNKVLSDDGYDCGIVEDGLNDLSEFYRSIWPHYYDLHEVKMPGTIDYRVYQKGIPGGQISIFKAELERNRMGHLFDSVMNTIQDVRDDAGGVSLVTPTADNTARQATLNAQDRDNGKESYSRIWPGYSEMLRGAMGQPRMPQNADLQKKALREFCLTEVNKMHTSGAISDDAHTQLKAGILDRLYEQCWELGQPFQNKIVMEQFEERMEQINSMNADEQAKLNGQLQDAGMSHTCETMMQELKDRVAKLVQSIRDTSVSQDEYESLLREESSAMQSVVPTILANNPKLTQLHQSGSISDSALLRTIKSACLITCKPSSVFPDNGLELAKAEVELLAQEHGFDLPPASSDEMAVWGVLQSMFRTSQGIATNWFCNYKTNKGFWPPIPGAEELDLSSINGAGADSNVVSAPFMYPFVTKLDSSLSTEPQVYTFSDAQLEKFFATELATLQHTNASIAYVEGALVEANISSTRRELLETRLNALEQTKDGELQVMEKRVRRLMEVLPTKVTGAVVNVDVDGSVQGCMSQVSSVASS